MLVELGDLVLLVQSVVGFRGHDQALKLGILVEFEVSNAKNLNHVLPLLVLVVKIHKGKLGLALDVLRLCFRQGLSEPCFCEGFVPESLGRDCGLKDGLRADFGVS